MAQIYGAESDPITVKNFVAHFVGQNHIKAKQDKRKTTVCIWGSKGIGKTDLVKQLAGTEVADRVIDIPIAQIEEMGDFHGLPIHKDTEDGRTVTVTAPPHWVPINPEEKTIVLIDDFNRADVRIIRGIMQLIQDHRTISWSLPALSSIVLTANPSDSDEGYLVTSLDPAILSRMAHITMVPEFRSWLAWGENNDVDPRVLSFIARYNEQLAPPGADRTCPRGWHMYSDAIKSLSAADATPALLKLYGSAVLDEDSVNPFLQFMEGDFEKVIEPELIVTSYMKNEEIKKKFLKLAADGRTDIINVTLSRLIAYVNNMSRVASGSDTQKNVIALMEEEFIYKDMKHLYVNLLAQGPMSNHIISSKLAIQLRGVM